MKFASVLLSFFSVAAGSLGFYCIFISALAVPAIQNQVIYLNKVKLTWLQDVNRPEQWGFLHNQVTPFRIHTPDGESLHAWHILPLGVYHRNSEALRKEPSGVEAADVTTRCSFRLLRDDPDALLVLYFHGAAGTLGSGWRPPSYRALSAAAPDRIHVVAIDYRGFGTSSGTPSEDGLRTDAAALADWAMRVAQIPPSRIVVFGQSLGTAVSVALVRSLAEGLHPPQSPVLFSGLVLVAPFADVAELAATYRIAGTIPLLGPVARYAPRALAYLRTLIQAQWPTRHAMADFVRCCEAMTKASSPTDGDGDGQAAAGPSRYHIAVLHAEDDYDVPWTHSQMVYWHAVNASTSLGISYEDLEKEKQASRTVLGDEGGWTYTRRTEQGMLKQHILKHGLHDRIMSYPAVSLAVYDAFQL